MPLASLAPMLAEARNGGYGVCYCESWNLESFQAVVQAAEECRSPIIAGFNGGFLRHRSRSQPEDLSFYASLKFALERSPVPVAFLLNESDSQAQIEQGIEFGFNAVMPENEGLTLDQYRALVNAVVSFARPRNVWVEAQIGFLPSGSATNNGHFEITDPDQARQFVEDTGVDALAVSIGNTHILTAGKSSVDMDVLRRIGEKVKAPLVLHGGTSIAYDRMRDLVCLGVAKFNFGTVLKQAYLDAVKESLSRYQRPLNPHPFLGMGSDLDIMVAGREAVKGKVKELLQACGSTGRARI
jgi:tagatose 1,6-diphosphate aldolase GatY/KbaY